MKLRLAFLLSLCLGACSEPQEKRDRLEITTSAPITIAVGDTSPVVLASRTVTELNGRISTDKTYTSFRLESGDSTVALVVELQKIVGKAVGETMVRAVDENSNLVSDSVKVKVVAKP